MPRLKSYKNTLAATYLGYVTQAVVNNFLPLLVVYFTKNYNISMIEITSLLTINYAFQLVMDFLCDSIANRIGYRNCMLIANALSVIGLVMFALLPQFMNDTFVALLLSIIVYGIGGGFIEVLISPIAEACPTRNKKAIMGFLHSSYCWGTVLVILVSTIFFHFLMDKWWIMILCWSVVPLIDGIYFLFVPIYQLQGDKLEANQKNVSLEKKHYISLFKDPIFWVILVMILTGGASELIVSSWASAFVEESLGLSKTLGDLLGPLIFYTIMGTMRIVYALFSAKVDLRKLVIASAAVCLISYLLITLAPNRYVSLFGIGLTGIGVGMLWPGCFSLASEYLPEGGTTLFSFLALFGDIGCFAGPEFAGAISAAHGDDLKLGILASIGFPTALLIAAILLLILSRRRTIKKVEN